MRFISERARWRALVMAVALLNVTVLVTSSAGAAANDDFAAWATDYWFNQYNGNGRAGAPVVWIRFRMGTSRPARRSGWRCASSTGGTT